jgi:hypothetical protein
MLGAADTLAHDIDRNTTSKMWSSDVRQPTGASGAPAHQLLVNRTLTKLRNAVASVNSVWEGGAEERRTYCWPPWLMCMPQEQALSSAIVESD